MGDAASAQSTPFPYTFATWVFQLHVAGITPDDGELASACQAIDDATEQEAGDKAGDALVNRIKALVDEESPEAVHAVASKLYGDRVANGLGDGGRADRTHRIRKYQFERGLPWLARVWERHEDGDVRPTWLLVERVTDQVVAMDPNPWNDIDEERELPVSDFQVLWELDGCSCVCLQ